MNLIRAIRIALVSLLMCSEQKECNHFGDGELRFDDALSVCQLTDAGRVLGRVNDPFLALDRACQSCGVFTSIMKNPFFVEV